MARGAVDLRPPRNWQAADASLERPTPLGQGPSFQLESNIALVPLAGNNSEMLMMPPGYYERDDVGEDAPWRRSDNGSVRKCWKTTLIYQHVQPHPRLVR